VISPLILPRLQESRPCVRLQQTVLCKALLAVSTNVSQQELVVFVERESVKTVNRLHNTDQIIVLQQGAASIENTTPSSIPRCASAGVRLRHRPPALLRRIGDVSAMPSPGLCTMPSFTVESYPSQLTNSRASLSLLTIHRLTPWTFITSWNFFAIVASNSSISSVEFEDLFEVIHWATRLMDCRLVLRSLS